MVSKNEACVRLRLDFPGLNESDFEITSPVDRQYNCIAWAANDNARWWWPDPNAYWPTNRSDVTIGNFEEAFATLGYTRGETDSSPAVVERLLLYLNNGVPTHAARQLENGMWAAKLGQAWDVEHQKSAFCGGAYGEASIMFERPRS
jgi:hypothetical protein